ncbi:MAG: glycosyltransferase family 39 protein [Candidatus Pacebacteria bacterium]|nr:glycosyltransferase family 39 protein [Candidatus Paceibacterota bacterium]
MIYVRVARETLARGEWMILYFCDNLWFEKPPLVIWLTMVSLKIFGFSELTVWFFPALAGVFSLLGIYFLGKKIFNSKIGILAFFALLMTPHFLLMSRNNMMDIFFLFPGFFNVIFRESYLGRKNLVWSFFLLGCAFMFKSVVALLILPVFLYHMYLYDNWHLLKSRYFYRGLAVFFS